MKKARIWGTALLVFLFDRLTKWLVTQNMELFESRPIIPGIFSITYVKNPGAAFGMLAGQRMLFLAITACVLAFVIYYTRFVKKEHVFLQVVLGMQVGGAVGNVVDRFREGMVVDFLDFHFWPIFNIADSGIVIGTVLLIYTLLRYPDSLSPQES